MRPNTLRCTERNARTPAKTFLLPKQPAPRLRRRLRPRHGATASRHASRSPAARLWRNDTPLRATGRSLARAGRLHCAAAGCCGLGRDLVRVRGG